MLQGKGEGVFSASVVSPRAVTLHGTTAPLNHFIRQGGNPSLFLFARNETRFPNLVLFDQIVPPGETTLALHCGPRISIGSRRSIASENPSGSIRDLGMFSVNLSTTAPSVTKLTNVNMDVDVSVSMRTVD